LSFPQSKRHRAPCPGTGDPRASTNGRAQTRPKRTAARARTGGHPAAKARHRHGRRPYHDPADAGRSSDPTTSFLTAAMIIYAIGAGVTAAAGTRLALQWVLVKEVSTRLIPGAGTLT